MDCPDTDSEEEHTIRMVCTESSEDSKCDHIHRGQGAPSTILQMPNRCGLSRRSVYDLTFDYDFKRVPRDFGDAMMRIDYVIPSERANAQSEMNLASTRTASAGSKRNGAMPDSHDRYLQRRRSPPERYALDVDEDETPSSDLPSEEQIRDQLSLETSVGSFSLHPEFQVSQDANIVTVTNTPEGKTPDIQYIVLEILSRQTQEEDRENSFPIGALHNISTGDDQPPTSKRITPQIPEKHIITGQGRFCELFRLFTVVLDRAKFVSEAGVYFYMAYLDGSENPDPSMQDAPDDTQVVRGVDMSTVARRLGVVVLDG
ncbi:uncharacterized protein N7446_010164 [Penicillium canescens]|uniref:Uncharacterized protein n=1 Tax=Penicillium canescens TaxID=5083 RepID=A0AAD6I8G4_PENCN|nr:uncharacterized protein N7446_010164 [Penicillium canescens]KAJ6035403.1 hypothetical protein N7460_009578 [Penicillium canescens]KAJ6037529.1 hypothetical protein N7444_010234 [Penicillium canescens]KAJ6054152.1 hypothetical protein N7446_010164 [Penicillium canescens]